MLPLLVARGRDADVLRAAEVVSGSTRFKQFSEMYRAEALWNLGKTPRGIPRHGRLEQYLRSAFSRGVLCQALQGGALERVPYGHEWPHGATLEYVNKVKNVCETQDVSKIRSALAYDADFNEALRWVLWHAPDFVACPTLICLSCVRNRSVEKIFRERLIGLDLTFDAMEIISGLSSRRRDKHGIRHRHAEPL